MRDDKIQFGVRTKYEDVICQLRKILLTISFIYISIRSQQNGTWFIRRALIDAKEVCKVLLHLSRAPSSVLQGREREGNSYDLMAANDKQSRHNRTIRTHHMTRYKRLKVWRKYTKIKELLDLLERILK